LVTFAVVEAVAGVTTGSNAGAVAIVDGGAAWGCATGAGAGIDVAAPATCTGTTGGGADGAETTVPETCNFSHCPGQIV
jgi:hypothetical protein